MNPYTIDAAHRARVLELPEDEVMTLSVAGSEIIEAMQAQIMLLKREISWRDDRIEELEGQLSALGINVLEERKAI
jgi:hypothetical protein